MTELMPDTNTDTELSAKDRLIEIKLDEASIARVDPTIDHERQVAIFDLLEHNVFAVVGHEDAGPFRLDLSLVEDRLHFQVCDEAAKDVTAYELPLLPFRRILKDYFMVLESYQNAVREGNPGRIEAIDVGRRGLHDEGSQILKDRIKDRFIVDFDTARRLFTLLGALHWKG